MIYCEGEKDCMSVILDSLTCVSVYFSVGWRTVQFTSECRDKNKNVNQEVPWNGKVTLGKRERKLFFKKSKYKE